MPMKFKQIQAFITVAREGNMTLAAEKMGITQSGLSRLDHPVGTEPTAIEPGSGPERILIRTT